MSTATGHGAVWTTSELATLEYIDWFRSRRLHEACNYRLRAEHEAAYYDQHNTPVAPAGAQ